MLGKREHETAGEDEERLSQTGLGDGNSCLSLSCFRMNFQPEMLTYANGSQQTLLLRVLKSKVRPRELGIDTYF